MQAKAVHACVMQVHLAKWRETTVAVKVLSSTGVSSSLEEEFPEGSPTARDHPLFESLQKVQHHMLSKCWFFMVSRHCRSRPRAAQLL